MKIIEKSLKIIGQDQRRPLAPGGQRGETPNDTHYKTRSLKEMRLSCGLRMLLKLQATPMLSFSSELKNNEKQKLALGGRAGRRPAGHTTKFHFFGLTLGKSSPYALAHSFARTHARNATATETEIDFPVGSTPQPPILVALV